MLLDGGNPPGKLFGFAGATGEHLPPKREAATIDRQRTSADGVCFFDTPRGNMSHVNLLATHPDYPPTLIANASQPRDPGTYEAIVVMRRASRVVVDVRTPDGAAWPSVLVLLVQNGSSAVIG